MRTPPCAARSRPISRDAVNDVSRRPDSLAPYAARDEASRGRRYAEEAPELRGEFQRDRDRIIHSNAFRRLVYKTQVFVNHEGDLYRTRITHSLEVAQIGRSIARALNLNEALTEAISLAHDLGHTPFGHAGQEALNGCMRKYGGFEHNLQSLRVVDELEERYAEFPGLNLTFECREGILKHCSARNARTLGDVGERFLKRQQPGLEAQIANLADEIAYNNHDVDDGVRAGLIDVPSLCEVALFRRHHDEVVARYPDLGGSRLVHEILRRMINAVVVDLVRTAQAQIAAAKPKSIDDVRARSKPLIALSDTAREEHLELKTFLRERVYQHYKVLRMTSKARRTLTQLFEAFFHDVNLMPTEHRLAAHRAHADKGDAGRARAVADYVAGMTDRYAILEHRRVFEPGERT
jgi:dGTPase